MNFDKFVGNERVVMTLQIALNSAAKQHKTLPHILLLGGAGLGKTTLSRIIAQESNVNFVDIVGGDIRNIDHIAKCVLKLGLGGIWFIDEMHTLPRGVQDIMLPLIEGFRLAHNQSFVSVPPFTLIGATTEPSKLVKPYQDRFQYRIQLREYTENELKQILINNIDYAEITEPALRLLASICRNTARYAINYANPLLKDYWIAKGTKTITETEVYEMMAVHGIYERGGNKADINYLTKLKDDGIQGYETLKAKIGYELIDETEKFLLKIGFIEKTALGRKITINGIKYLKGIKI